MVLLTAESTAGIDNVTTIAVATGGTGYKGSAPAITIPVPTVRTITKTSKVSTAITLLRLQVTMYMQTGTT